MPRVIESFHEFARRQACPYVTTTAGVSARSGEDVQRFLFANGAMSDGFRHSEPPDDRRRLLTRRREYVRTRLDREERDFQAYKGEVLTRTEMHRQYPMSCPPPPADAPARLEAGRDRILALRRELAGIEDQLRDTEAERRAEQRRRDAAGEQVRQTMFTSAVLAIDPDRPAPPADPTPDPAPTEARSWTSC